jgi:hypothetical protein
MTSKIYLKGVRAYGYVGYLPEENVLGQWFEVEATLWVDFEKATHNDEIEDFICLYNLITKNIVNNNYSRNGYFYIFMTSKNDTFKFNIIEYISEYSFKNNLFDMIILMNVMENGFDDNIHYKILNGSSKLYYYMYNLKLPLINPSKNGLVTI